MINIFNKNDFDFEKLKYNKNKHELFKKDISKKKKIMLFLNLLLAFPIIMISNKIIYNNISDFYFILFTFVGITLMVGQINLENNFKGILNFNFEDFRLRLKKNECIPPEMKKLFNLKFLPFITNDILRVADENEKETLKNLIDEIIEKSILSNLDKEGIKIAFKDLCDREQNITDLIYITMEFCDKISEYNEKINSFNKIKEINTINNINILEDFAKEDFVFDPMLNKSGNV